MRIEPGVCRRRSRRSTHSKENLKVNGLKLGRSSEDDDESFDPCLVKGGAEVLAFESSAAWLAFALSCFDVPMMVRSKPHFFTLRSSSSGSLSVESLDSGRASDDPKSASMDERLFAG